MSSIPDELYLQILIRIPVKSTFTCKCVCKNWLDLISSPMFVKMHLDFSIQKNNYNLMLNGVYYISQGNQLHSISYDSLSNVTSMNELQGGVVNMDFPFESVDNHVAIRSSCNGLVCLGFYQVFTELVLCLWNPATNEYKKLPKPPNEYKTLPKPPRGHVNHSEKFNFLHFIAAYALGCDYRTGDYKLVKVVDSFKGKGSLVYVYTLSLNSWKCIQTIPYNFVFERGSGEIVSGIPHWLVRTATNSKAVLSFDIIDERFEELELPEVLLGKKNLFTSVGKWEECVCLLVSAESADNSIKFDVWVLQEYKVRDSWSRHFSITLRSVARNSDLRLLWSFKNGKILLRTSGDLVLYDLENERETSIGGIARFSSVVNYVDSLVSLNSGAYVGR